MPWIYADTRPPSRALLDHAARGAGFGRLATIGLLQQRAFHRPEVLAEQLRDALNSRVAIEQAKGVLAERWQVSVDQAFEVLRSHSRKHNRRLSELAQAVADGSEQIPPPVT